MKGKQLKTGDVIYLENGMSVYGEVPSKFVYSNAKKSNEKTRHELVVGRVLTNDTDISKDVEGLVQDIVHAFQFRLGTKISKTDAFALIEKKISVPKASTFCLEGGEYLVIRTAYDGGGTGMGPNDIYPDGHHVFCRKLGINGHYDADGIEVDFYQSGSFTAMIEPGKVTVVRRMEQKFV